MSRTARIERATSESSVVVEINLDGTGQTDISTTVPFYDHMLTALGRHSLIDITVRATGDTEIDVHHTVEDTAICIGEALRVALGDKRGIRRFGEASVPLDEALAHAVVDISGRPFLVHEGESEAFVHHLIGGHFTGSTVRHDLEAIAYHAVICPGATPTTSPRRRSRPWLEPCAPPWRTIPVSRPSRPRREACNGSDPRP